MSENNDNYFEVYGQQDPNDLQDNGHDSNPADSNEQTSDDQVEDAGDNWLKFKIFLKKHVFRR